jgi:hypothetical protein
MALLRFDFGEKVPSMTSGAQASFAFGFLLLERQARPGLFKCSPAASTLAFAPKLALIALS